MYGVSIVKYKTGMRNAHKILIGRTSQFGRHKVQRGYDNNLILSATIYEQLDWILFTLNSNK